MKKGISSVLILSLLVAMMSFFATTYSVSTSFASGDSFISLELDKNSAKMGDVINATIRINNITNFAAYQVNIKYDPTVLQAIDPNTGIPLGNNTMPGGGDVLNKPEYGGVHGVLNDVDKGILNFGKTYVYLSDYKNSPPEETGVLVKLRFKVIGEKGDTSIKFENTPLMPSSISGTMLFDYNSKKIPDYTVIQPQVISIPDSQNPPWSQGGKVTIDLDKSKVAVGDIVTATINATNVDSLAGYQLNIKYDPTLLKPVVSTTGEEYKNSTMPEDGTLLVNTDFGAISAVSNTLDEGILNFGKAYTFVQDYKASKNPETSGIIAKISFKALRPSASTGISFENTITMPKGIRGTMLFNWDGKQIPGYEVTDSDKIIIVSEGVIVPTPTPVPTHTTIPTPTQTPASKNSIELQVDKNVAAIGDIVKATVRVDNIENLSAYQINIKYDPKILEPIDPNTGAKFNEKSVPGNQTILTNPRFMPLSIGANDISGGIINFSRVYIYSNDYRASKMPEKTGVLGEINFKVIGVGDTKIEFSDSPTMPTGISGTMLFDWYGKRILNYDVIQQGKIKISDSSVKPTPTSTPYPTGDPAYSSSIELKLDKNEARVGDIIEATLDIENIKEFAAYQVNIEYDPKILQAIDLETGKPLQENQVPNKGSVLTNPDYGVISAVANDIKTGVLNFGKTYTYLTDYRLSNNPEETGTLVRIGFKVIKEGETYIKLSNCPTMLKGIMGTLLFDWNGKIKTDYRVINPGIIKINKSPHGPTPSEDDSYIMLDLDRNNAVVGDIISAKVKVNNIKNFARYQINIKYDPEVLEPIDPNLGTVFTKRTPLKNGNILLNEDYLLAEITVNDLDKGILNFSKTCIFMDDYIECNRPEETGVLGEIKFRVLKNEKTEIKFCDHLAMPGAIVGTYLFDWNTKKLLTYSVIQPEAIN
ncbi:MAG: cellulosome anchor protein [Clostridium sp.]|nr:cellulosome anchor protein [Clostridium sp.]